MSYGKSVVPDLMGGMICLMGAGAQIRLAHRLRLSTWANYLSAFLLVFIYFCDEENMIPAVRRMLPAAYRAHNLPAAIELWSFCLIAIFLLFFVRDRIPSAKREQFIDSAKGENAIRETSKRTADLRRSAQERARFARFFDDRRAFLQRTSTALCVATPVAVIGAGFLTRKDFQVQEVDIAFPNLPKDLQGLRLLQISDIHIGSFFGPRDLRRVVDASNGIGADLIFITGDLITDRWDPLDLCIAELSRLRCPAGLWGCMGNHELYSRLQNATEQKARDAGINFLRHTAVPLRFGNSSINLVGVDYQPKAHPYLARVEELHAPDSFNLLLSHNPDVFPVAKQKGFDLTLAGHTHGGQINFEILSQNLNIADFFTPYTKGLYQDSNSAVYVNSGLGTIGLPVRLGVPPEITVIRLCNS